MKVIDFIIIAILAVVIFFAVRAAVKRKGRCSCGCGSCSQNGCPYKKGSD